MSSATQDGDSALTLAAKHGHTDIVVELVKAGANLNLQNKVHTVVRLLRLIAQLTDITTSFCMELKLGD